MSKIVDTVLESDIFDIMFSKVDTEGGLSFEEKSVWVQLLSLLLVLAAYGFVAGNMLANGVLHIVPYVPVFAIAVGLLVVLLIVGHIVAVMGGAQPRDERDRMIGWRAESNASWILGAGVLAALAGLICSLNPVWVAHLLLFFLFLSEIVKLALQIFYYRRGF